MARDYVQVNAVDRAIVLDRSDSHGAVFREGCAAALALKPKQAQRIFRDLELSGSIENKQIDDALAGAPGNRRAADVLDRQGKGLA
jgi:hypothetical protein